MLGGVSSTPDKSVSFTNGTLSFCGVTGEVPLPDEHPIMSHPERIKINRKVK
jgi:hypothetical protein